MGKRLAAALHSSKDGGCVRGTADAHSGPSSSLCWQYDLYPSNAWSDTYLHQSFHRCHWKNYNTTRDALFCWQPIWGCYVFLNSLSSADILLKLTRMVVLFLNSLSALTASLNALRMWTVFFSIDWLTEMNCMIKTTCAACSAVDTICPRPLQVVTWTATHSFQLGGRNMLMVHWTLTSLYNT